MPQFTEEQLTARSGFTCTTSILDDTIRLYMLFVYNECYLSVTRTIKDPNHNSIIITTRNKVNQ